jgi:fructosamine-3-kinase
MSFDIPLSLPGSLPGRRAEDTSPLQVRAVGEVSISNACHITAGRHQYWFCKINDVRRFPDLFVLERQGLALLGATGTVRVPEVLACKIIAGQQVLMLEWVLSADVTFPHLSG